MTKIKFRDLNLGLKFAIVFAWMFGVAATITFLVGLFGLPDCFCFGF